MTDRSVIAYPAILHFSESRHYIREVSPANTLAYDSAGCSSSAAAPRGGSGGGEDNGEASGVGGAMTDCRDAHTIHQVMPEALPKFHGQMMLMASLVPIRPLISEILQVLPKAQPKFNW